MNLLELKEWIKSAKRFDTTNEFTDKCGNEEYYLIFQKDEKFYRVQYCNGHPTEKYISGVGYCRGEYNPPKEVVRKTRTVEQVYYE